MSCEERTKEQLEAELLAARQRIARLEDQMQKTALRDAVYGTDLEWERTFDAVPDLIAVLDTGFRIVRVNKAMSQTLGSTPEQLIGATCYECMHLANVPPENCPHAALLADGKEHVVEVFEPRLNATLLVSASPLFNHNGSLVGSIHVARDITPRVKAEQALLKARDELEQRVRERTAELAEANEKLVKEISDRERAEEALRSASAYNRSLIEASLDPLVTISAEGKITDANRATERVTGYSRQELGGTDFADYFTEPEKAKAGYLLAFQAGSVRDYELEIRHKRGNPTPVMYNASVYRDSSGQMLGLFAAARDISAQKRAEEVIAKRNRDIEAILNATADSAFLLSSDGSLVALNSAAAQRFGRTIDEMTGKHIGEFLPPEVRTSQMERLDEAMRTRRPVRFEDVSAGRNYSASYYPIIGPGRKVEGVAVFASDVTDRKKWEAERERLISELEAKNTELERFTYSVSHDLKSPLITIKSFVGFIEDEVAGGTIDNLQADLGRINNAADKMGQLLDEILELSRVGRVTNPPSEVPLTDMANEVLELLSGRIIERSVDVTVLPDLPVLYGDGPRLREVLQNLIENAVKFMNDQPHPKIEIGARREGNETILYVRDNGMGIDPTDQYKVFGLFDKLDQKTEGTGIGLALVKRIVELHNGRIWVESEGIGKGSTFCFTVPLAEQAGDRSGDDRRA